MVAAQFLLDLIEIRDNFSLVLAMGVISLAKKVTASLVESNGSLPPSL